jgi:CheY-like chemotaxis protein
MNSALEGTRVLIVEDEYLVASLIEEVLESAGCIVCGPVSRLAEAVRAADRTACDVAVLDVNLAGERVYPVAEILARRNVPFVFITGYGQKGLPGEYAQRPRLSKPFRVADLLDTLSNAV